MNLMCVYGCMWSKAVGTKVKINEPTYGERYQKRVGVLFVTTPVFQEELCVCRSLSLLVPPPLHPIPTSSVYGSRLHGLHLFLRLTCRFLPQPNLLCMFVWLETRAHPPQPCIVICVEP